MGMVPSSEVRSFRRRGRSTAATTGIRSNSLASCVLDSAGKGRAHGVLLGWMWGGEGVHKAGRRVAVLKEAS